MKKFLLAALLLFCIQLQAQDVSVRQGDLERRKYKSGVMLLYYGENRIINYVSLYTVDFKNEDSEERIAGVLKENHKTPIPYMYFEFKEGYDCKNAQSYLGKKGINKMAIRSCLNVSFKDNPTTTATIPVSDDKARIKEVANILKPRYNELKSQGWVETSSVFTMMGGLKSGMGEKQVFKTGNAYKILAAANGTETLMMVYNRDVSGMPTTMYGATFGSGTVMESPVLHFNNDINDVDPYAVAFLGRGLGVDNDHSFPGGMIVMQKAYSFEEEFSGVLNDAANGFKQLNGYNMADELRIGVTTSSFSLNMFGTTKRPFLKKQQDGTGEYTFVISKSAPGFEQVEAKILKAMEVQKKANGDTVEVIKNGTLTIYNLVDKKGKNLSTIMVRPDEISIIFLGTNK